jgi:cbb3-type cytochrome oxidase subunit 1
MNWLALVDGGLTLFAFAIHTLVGGREFVHLVPADTSKKAMTVRRQVVNGWHWVSVDLVLAGSALVAIGVTDLPAERDLLLGLAIYFAIIGVVWFVATVVTSRDRPVRILELGQWILCFVIAGLAWLAR